MAVVKNTSGQWVATYNGQKQSFSTQSAAMKAYDQMKSATAPKTTTKTTTSTSPSASRTATPTNTTASPNGGNYYNWQGAYFEKKADGTIVAVSDKKEINRLNSAPDTAIMGSPYDSTPQQTTPQTTPKTFLKDLSIGLANGTPITQADINAGNIPKTGGTDLQDLSVALANQQGGQIDTTKGAVPSTVVGQDTTQNTPQGSVTPQSTTTSTPTSSENQGTITPQPDGSMSFTPQSTQPQQQGAVQAQPVQRQLTQEDYYLKPGESPQQYNDRIARLRGETVTPQPTTPSTVGTFAGQAQKFGLTQTGDQFQADPISSIKNITKQVLSAMGYDQATNEYTKVTKELEKLQNQKDDEIRAINDNPWLTEGVRLRQVQKAKEKWADKIDSRTNTLRLLDSVRDDARQQAQFAVGTAISVWDSERKFQQQQQQMYYDQAQREFENNVALYKATQPGDSGATSEMKEYTFAVQQGFHGDFLAYKTAIAAAGRAPSSGGEYTGQYTKAQIAAITKINESVSKNATYAKTASMRGYIDNVNAALAQANGLSDIAAINQFQKVIDEGAVTRDQDVVLIQGAQSLVNSLNTKIAGLKKGEKLGTQQRTQMQQLMEQIYNAQVNALNKDPYIAAKKKEASIYGLTETDTILGELGGFGGQQSSGYGPVQSLSQPVYTNETTDLKFTDSPGEQSTLGKIISWLL